MSAAVLAAGVLFGVGLRVAQWLVPVPDTRVEVCAPSENDDGSCVPMGSEQPSPDDEDSDASNSVRA